MRRIFLVLLGALSLAGCATSPDVKQPQNYMAPGQYAPPRMQQYNTTGSQF